MLKKLLLIPVALMMISATAHADIVDRIVAVVGKDIITVKDLRDEGRVRLMVAGKNIEFIDEIEDKDEREKAILELVNVLVQSKIVERMAKDMKVPIGNRELEAHLQAMYDSTGKSEEEYKAYLEQEGIDWEMFRKYILSEMRAQYVMQAELAGQLNVSEADVIDCAKELSPENEQAISMTLSQILIADTKADTALGQDAVMTGALNGVWWNTIDRFRYNIASALSEELEKNPDRFGEFVEQFSAGRSAERKGLLGTFSIGDLSKDFKDIFALDVGEISKPVSTSSGYHIMRVDDKQEAENEKWLKNMKQCRAKIQQRETDRLLKSWLDGLTERNFVKISIFDDLAEKR